MNVKESCTFKLIITIIDVSNDYEKNHGWTESINLYISITIYVNISFFVAWIINQTTNKLYNLLIDYYLIFAVVNIS